MEHDQDMTHRRAILVIIVTDLRKTVLMVASEDVIEEVIDVAEVLEIDVQEYMENDVQVGMENDAPGIDHT